MVTEKKVSHLTHLAVHGSQGLLSVGTSAGADYYAEAQAEYYLGGSEPTGIWWNALGHFGLKDGADVDVAAFKALHGGFNPRTGKALVQNAGSDKRRGGYDLTFSADKSISALWAVAPADMKTEIEAAQQAAVRAALSHMQEHAAETRRGKGGATREPVRLFGALFQHGDTRAGDPELHTHAVVLNAAQREDGTWGSVANEKLFQWKMAVGALYRTELAAQLQQRLGLAIERHGDREEFIRLKGVPEDLCDIWSKRRADIEAAAAEKGFKTGDDAARAAGLTLAIRGKKGNAEGREERWADEAAAQGWGAEQAQALRGQAQGDPVAARNLAWAEVTRRVREVVAHESVFTEQKLWQVTAEAAAGVFPARDVGGLVNRLEAEGVVVRLPSQTEKGQTVYSTREAIEDEVAVRALAKAAAKAPALTVAPSMADTAIDMAEKRLTGEQAQAARHAMTAGGGVVLVEGAPGVGKTTLLRPVVLGYRGAGAQRVIATAVAWRQARDLGGGIGAEHSLAADAMLSRWRRGELEIGAGTVIVVDELGQWSARQTRRLMELQRATGCRIVGVGDRRQLQPVGAGPGMRLLAMEAPPAAVDTIVRQSDLAAREAVRAVMDGKAGPAIRAHRERGHIREAADHAGAVEVAALRWREIRAAGQSTVVIAEQWTEVRALSKAIRAQLRDLGALGDDALTLKAAGSTAGRSVKLAVAVGDELRFRYRDDRLGVVNGDTGRVIAIEGATLTMDVGGRQIVVDTAQYRDKDGYTPLAYGYASTLAAAQGLTVDAPVLLASDRLTRQAATVALSRGTDWTTVVVDRGAIEEAIRAGRPDEEARNPVTTTEVDEHLGRAWSRDGEKVSALDYLDAERVEAWVNGWRGSLPAEALSPSGQPVAEVVNLAAARVAAQKPQPVAPAQSPKPEAAPTAMACPEAEGAGPQSLEDLEWWWEAIQEHIQDAEMETEVRHAYDAHRRRIEAQQVAQDHAAVAEAVRAVRAAETGKQAAQDRGDWQAAAELTYGIVPAAADGEEHVQGCAARLAAMSERLDQQGARIAEAVTVGVMHATGRFDVEWPHLAPMVRALEKRRNEAEGEQRRVIEAAQAALMRAGERLQGAANRMLHDFSVFLDDEMAILLEHCAMQEAKLLRRLLDAAIAKAERQVMAGDPAGLARLDWLSRDEGERMRRQIVTGYLTTTAQTGAAMREVREAGNRERLFALVADRRDAARTILDLGLLPALAEVAPQEAALVPRRAARDDAAIEAWVDQKLGPDHDYGPEMG